MLLAGGGMAWPRGSHLARAHQRDLGRLLGLLLNNGHLRRPPAVHLLGFHTQLLGGLVLCLLMSQLLICCGLIGRLLLFSSLAPGASPHGLHRRRRRNWLFGRRCLPPRLRRWGHAQIPKEGSGQNLCLQVFFCSSPPRDGLVPLDCFWRRIESDEVVAPPKFLKSRGHDFHLTLGEACKIHTTSAPDLRSLLSRLLVLSRGLGLRPCGAARASRGQWLGLHSTFTTIFSSLSITCWQSVFLAALHGVPGGP
mmetsp:Transcript_96371/g.173885  ORF Transcript_96371/g.173885 Transcript_96371/m.173885 type:complete len:252 (+) Transcript_96371:1023-1778(+)